MGAPAGRRNQGLMPPAGLILAALHVPAIFSATDFYFEGSCNSTFDPGWVNLSTGINTSRSIARIIRVGRLQNPIGSAHITWLTGGVGFDDRAQAMALHQD